MTRGQNNLLDECKMAAGNMISIGGGGGVRLWSTCKFQQQLKGSWWDFAWIAAGYTSICMCVAI